jgi:asparagine synthase (glutamine-hydrolysing)
VCGIAGIVRFDGAPVAQERLVAMTRALAHRGPDGEGIWTAPGVGFGHRRLAIRDLSDAGRQPMLDDAGTVCVAYNGELFDDARLRRAIERETGYAFRTGCDTELLPIGWRTWGEALFDRIEGMFAIAIWDLRTRTLVLARDAAGIKPLYWHDDGTTLRFASEVKGLVAGGVPAEVDPAAFHTYLACGYPEPDASLLRGVRQLAPGSILVASAGGRRQHRFWRPTRTGARHDLPAAAREVGETLRRVAADMRVADVPLGLLQSGGIDSALLAMQTDASVPCFTASFAERSHDETADARRIAAAGGHAWQSVPVGGDASTLAADFVAVARHVDGELADSSCLAHYVLSRAVRRHTTVALAGDGADEFFGGYPTYRASRLAGRIAPWLPRGAAAIAADRLEAAFGADEARLPWHAVAARFLRGLAAPDATQHAEWRRLAPAGALPALYGPAMRELLDVDPLAAYRAPLRGTDGEPPGATLLDRCLLADQRVYLPGDMLAKVDRMSMAHGLEIRVPFLDRRMMDLAGRLDGRLLAPLRGPAKRVLRAALAGTAAPADVVRGAKRGFNVPIAMLLRRELAPVGDRLFGRDVSVFEPLLAPDALRAAWREHLEGRRNHAYLLWALMIHGAWRAPA